MRIVFVIDYLRMGGAERVIISLANQFAQCGWPVTMITLDGGRVTPFIPLDKRVRHVAVDEGAGSSRLGLSAGFYRSIRRETQKAAADVVVSFLCRVNIAVLFATRFMRVPVIICERNNTERLALGTKMRVLMRLLYPRAASIVFQTDGLRNHYLDRYSLDSSRCTVIPNAAPAVANGNGDLALNRPTIAALGRLCAQKGFDLLIRAYAKIADRHPDWTLTIIGEGDERSRLEQLRSDLQLEERIHLPGASVYPQAVLKSADIFVLPSRYEGFPNVLLEAMSCGLPVVAADCDYGPRDIIEDGVTGILVPPEHVDAIAGVLDQLIRDPNRRRTLAKRAVDVRNRFDHDKIMRAWQHAVATTVENYG